MKKRKLTTRLGPLGLSLAAAVVTAVAFAAVSIAAGGSGSGGGSSGKDTQRFRTAPPGGRGGMVPRDNLSDADRKKLEDFRKCMQGNGAPPPPAPGRFDPSRKRPKPPSKADREKLQKAWEACKDKLPEAMQKAGPPRLHGKGCGPPPGAPGAPGSEQGKRQNQGQSNHWGSGSSGSSS